MNSSTTTSSSLVDPQEHFVVCCFSCNEQERQASQALLAALAKNPNFNIYFFTTAASSPSAIPTTTSQAATVRIIQITQDLTATKDVWAHFKLEEIADEIIFFIENELHLLKFLETPKPNIKLVIHAFGTGAAYTAKLVSSALNVPMLYTPLEKNAFLEELTSEQVHDVEQELIQYAHAITVDDPSCLQEPEAAVEKGTAATTTATTAAAEEEPVAATTFPKQFKNYLRRPNDVMVVKNNDWEAILPEYLSKRDLYCQLVDRYNSKPIRFADTPQEKQGKRYILVCDIDGTLKGEDKAFPPKLMQQIQVYKKQGKLALFGIATGRYLDEALQILQDWGVTMPDFVISETGSCISFRNTLLTHPEESTSNVSYVFQPSTDEHLVYSHKDFVEYKEYSKHIDYLWSQSQVSSELRKIPFLTEHVFNPLNKHVSCFHVKTNEIPEEDRLRPMRGVKTALRKNQIACHPLHSHTIFLDVLPVRANKGTALRFLSLKWGVPIDHFIVAGDSRNDLEMLVGRTKAVVVANHLPELDFLKENAEKMHNVYFASTKCAAGVLEGLIYYMEKNEDVVPATR